MSENFLRPSILPKLALCGHFRSGEAGEAAERGTRIDEAFRAAISPTGNEIINAEPTPADEIKAVKWAVETARIYAMGKPLDATEENLRIEAEGMTGTADLLCEKGGWSADLKTGMQRDYYAQQAAYALGFMKRFGVDNWTVHLFYCDAEVVETYEFTREGAIEAIHDALALYRGGVPPQVNDYCGWCSKRFDCSARQEFIGVIPEFREIDMTKATSSRLTAFCNAAKVVAEYAEKAREVLTARVVGGEKVENVTLTAGRKTRTVPVENLLRFADKIDVREMIMKVGTLSEEKAKAILGDYFTLDLVNENRGDSYITIRKPKG